MLSEIASILRFNIVGAAFSSRNCRNNAIATIDPRFPLCHCENHTARIEHNAKAETALAADVFNRIARLCYSDWIQETRQ